MRATVIHGAGDVRVEDVPDPVLREPTDAVVRVLRSCICGSDLWPYGSMPASEQGRRIGHEFLGVVEDIGAEVSGLKARRRRGGAVRVGGQHLRLLPGGPADLVPARRQLGRRRRGRRAGRGGAGAAGAGHAGEAAGRRGLGAAAVAADAVRRVPTGHHCAVTAGVSPRTTVTVIGDGAVGPVAVLAAKRLGAEQIILMGRHKARTDLGREFGATDVVAERGEEGVAKVRELTGGDGTHTVLECVGLRPALETAFGVVRAGGDDQPGRRAAVPGRAGRLRDVSAQHHPHRRRRPGARLHRGAAARRARGHLEPGKVFDRTVDLDGVPDGYRAMDDREALKVLVRP